MKFFPHTQLRWVHALLVLYGVCVSSACLALVLAAISGLCGILALVVAVTIAIFCSWEEIQHARRLKLENHRSTLGVPQVAWSENLSKLYGEYKWKELKEGRPTIAADLAERVAMVKEGKSTVAADLVSP